MARPLEDSEDHGVHIPRWSGATGIAAVAWYPASMPEVRARAQERTCECRLKVYYLMFGGGHAWIRRRARAAHHSDKVTTSDTERLRYPEAELLWTRIVLGRAR